MFSIVKVLLLIPLAGVDDLQNRSFFEREQTQNKIENNLNYLSVLSLEYQLDNGVISGAERRRRATLIIQNYWDIKPTRKDGKWPYIDALYKCEGINNPSDNPIGYHYLMKARDIIGNEVWEYTYPLATKLFVKELSKHRIPKQIINLLINYMEYKSFKWDYMNNKKRK